MATLTLTGAHGTSVANARRIKINGFNPSTGSGAIRGTAVYFWAYANHIELGKKLALAWCQKMNKKENPCATVFCSITCDNENYIDIDDIAVREGFFRFVDRKNKGRLDLTDADMCELYNAYYALLELENERRFKVIQVRIYFDSGVYSRRISANMYDCYVVRALDSISVQSILDEEGNEL